MSKDMHPFEKFCERVQKLTHEQLVQRDLEDQIQEELQLKQKQMSTEQKTKKEIKLSEVVRLLKSGYTRLQKDDEGSGSIQDHYKLSFSECKELFKHPELKGLKTKKVGFTLVNDLTPENKEITNPIDNLFN